MATITKTFTFATTVEGYAATTASGVTGGWDGTVGGAAAGSLKMRRAGKNLAAAQSYWEWTGTWEDLGVPADSIVTAIRLNSGWTRCSEYTVGASSTIGPYEIRDAAAALIGTLWTGRATTATDTGTAIAQQAAVTIPTHASATTVKIRLADTLATGSSNSAAVSTHDDDVALLITYTPALGVQPADSEGLSDQLALVANYLRDEPDDMTLADTQTSVADYVRNLAVESVGLTEVFSAQKDSPRFVTDSAGVTESIAVEVANNRALADGMGMTDSVTTEAVKESGLWLFHYDGKIGG